MAVLWLVSMLSGSHAFAQINSADGEAANVNQPTEPARTAEQAIATATDSFVLVEMRIKAVEYLAQFRTREVAGVLLSLTERAGNPAADDGVSAAAYQSLARLSGITDFGVDRFKWQDWYDSTAEMTEAQWHQMLLKNFDERYNQLAAQQAWAERQLLISERQLYDLLEGEARTVKLVEMLQNPLESVRLLGIELTVERLASSNLPGEKQLVVLRQLLDDPSPGVRRRSALLLSNVNDKAGAQIASRRLVEGREKRTGVLSAYLKLAWCDPNKDSMSAAMEFLEHAELGGDSARLLARGAGAGLLSDPQSQRVRLICRSKLEQAESPSAQLIELLGRVGEPQDWQRIELWLDADETSVKEAAALAWAQSEKSLLPLALRSADDVIRPIALRAATRKSRDPKVMMALADLPPQGAAAASAWSDALAAIAARVEPDDVLKVEKQLEDSEQPLAVRARVVAAAIDAINGNGNPARVVPVELLLRRARLHLDAGDFALAGNNFDAIRKSTAALTTDQRQQLNQGELRAALGLGNSAAAKRASEALLKPDDGAAPGDQANFVAGSFLETIRKNLDTNQLERARLLLALLNDVFPDGVPADFRRDVESLRARLAQLTRDAALRAPGRRVTGG